MKEKKTKESKKVEELEQQLKRALADYANLQRRFEEEKKTVTKFANTVLLVKFLDILDNLQEAQKTINSEGLALVIRKFNDLLSGENVKEISATGEEFDPNLHEGIGMVEGERDGEVAEVLQKGYQIEGKVIRPARVRVTQKAS
jgi:molecular chaperone GrpE